MEDTTQLKTELLAAVKQAADIKSLEEIRVSVLGKKGRITEMMKSLGGLSIEEKKEAGKTLNILKSEVEAALDSLLAMAGAESAVSGRMPLVTVRDSGARPALVRGVGAHSI